MTAFGFASPLAVRSKIFIALTSHLTLRRPAHRHLLGKQTKSTAPWLNDHGDFAGSLAGALFAFRRNSHYLRRAMHLWLTAREQPMPFGPFFPPEDMVNASELREFMYCARDRLVTIAKSAFAIQNWQADGQHLTVC
jgi:hypothetical protein